MGIKFNCPNGHKLNVKSFLAGRRGICPHCDARFRIPLESGGVAELVQKGERGGGEETQLTAAMQEDANAGEAMGSYPSAASFEPSFGSPLGTVVSDAPWSASPASPSSTSPLGSYPVASADPLAEDPQAVWYVRPRSGGQYGPAVAEILRDWIREGRVAGDSYVWREGWTDWRAASSVFPQLAGLLSAGAPAAVVSPVGGSLPRGNVPGGAAAPVGGAVASETAAGGAVVPVLGALPASGMAGLEASASAPLSVPLNKRTELRRRKGNFTALIVMLLVVVAVVLVGIFAWVVFGQPAPSTADLPAAISAPAEQHYASASGTDFPRDLARSASKCIQTSATQADAGRLF